MSSHLIRHLQHLKEKELFCDFDFILQNSLHPQQIKISAHSIILKQSEYFQRLQSNCLIINSDESKYDECLVRGALECIYGASPRVMEFHRVLPFLIEFEFFGVISDCVEAMSGELKVDRSECNNNEIILVWKVLKKLKASCELAQNHSVQDVMKLVVEKIRAIYSINIQMKESSIAYQQLKTAVLQFSADEFFDFFTCFTNDLYMGTLSKIMIEWIKENPTERTQQAGPILLKLQSLAPRSYIPPPPPIPTLTRANVPPPPLPVNLSTQTHRYGHTPFRPPSSMPPPPPPSTFGTGPPPPPPPSSFDIFSSIMAGRSLK
ncbi:predicted protein [Naegleria gruberi]|uniref:Predicted protein n=1 Tax=Naegleria gruberi TaxID=5762 RepID=D2W294_NAEGR|nr:uncharacterized protein NAEGRDRAFT_75506 [Naegleria gruberi]EFC36824.1 predicted protein [Naegleria gruberi]|eukprot:XP_002669568.1 predicted protein [Naegleria gruberi strain NEG-M]